MFNCLNKVVFTKVFTHAAATSQRELFTDKLISKQAKPSQAIDLLITVAILGRTSAADWAAADVFTA